MDADLVINVGQFERDFLAALAKRLNEGIDKSTNRIKERVRQDIDEAIRESPEYDSLLNYGTLRGQLGVPNADGVLEDIIKTIGESVAVTPIIVTVNGGRMTGGLRVEILRADYGDILGLPGASFPSEKHHQVDWLKWLLLEGGNAVIGDYHFFGSERLLGTSRAGRSLGRTGLGIMVPTGHWTVPEEFSGTATDNWLTRALSRTGPKAVAIMVEEIKRNLQ